MAWILAPHPHRHPYNYDGPLTIMTSLGGEQMKCTSELTHAETYTLLVAADRSKLRTITFYEDLTLIGGKMLLHEVNDTIMFHYGQYFI